MRFSLRSEGFVFPLRSFLATLRRESRNSFPLRLFRAILREERFCFPSPLVPRDSPRGRVGIRFPVRLFRAILLRREVLVSLSARTSRLSRRESRKFVPRDSPRGRVGIRSLSTYSVRLSLRRVLQGARNSSRVVTRSQLDLVERGLFTGPQYFQNFCSGRSALQSLGDVLTFVHDGGDDGLESLVDSRLTGGAEQNHQQVGSFLSPSVGDSPFGSNHEHHRLGEPSHARVGHAQAIAKIGFDDPFTLFDRTNDHVIGDRKGTWLHPVEGGSNRFDRAFGFDIELDAILLECIPQMNLLLIFELVSDRSDDFFDNVFEGQESSPTPGAIAHQGGMDPFLLHFREQGLEQGAVRDSDVGADQGSEVRFVLFRKEKVLKVDDPNRVLRVCIEERVPTEAVSSQRLKVLVPRDLRTETAHLGSRTHGVAHSKLAQIEKRFQEKASVGRTSFLVTAIG